MVPPFPTCTNWDSLSMVVHYIHIVHHSPQIYVYPRNRYLQVEDLVKLGRLTLMIRTYYY